MYICFTGSNYPSVDHGYCTFPDGSLIYNDKDVRKRYYYNITRHVCEEFRWHACGGNYNRYRTLDDCNHACVHDPLDFYVTKEV